MTQPTVPPVACPEPEVLGALAEGRLAGAERAAAVRHLATCRRCHEAFVLSVQILEEDGALPAVSDAAQPIGSRRPVMVWLSAAAAALVSSVVFLQRAPVVVPRMANVTPTPVATPSPSATVSPSPEPVQTAALPPEAIDALRTLRGFTSPYRGAASVGFAPDPRKLALRKGIEDIDDAARALAGQVAASPPALSGAVDGWRRAGRILEASRLALLARPGTADTFFASPWARSELSLAGSLLRDAGVADTSWVDDVRRPTNGDSTEALLDRLQLLLRDLA